MPWLLLILLGIGAAAIASSSSSGPAKPKPSIFGLAKGGKYEIVVRSTISRATFDLDAARQQLQALLGRQGFDVRAVAPNANGDPFVYNASGVYRGGTGTLGDVPGIILLSSTPIDALPPATIALAYIDERPVPLAQGAHYFGRGSIPWPASIVVSRDMVASKLVGAGFSDVHVYMKPEELPPDWPATERGGDVFASATYGGTAPSIDLPSQVLSVWQENAT